MFPLSHVYIATKVAQKETDLLILGSVIPDLAWFSLPLRGSLHNEPDEFWQFVRKNFSKDLDLALGSKLHSQVDRGADYYSDDLEVGYAKIKGREIVGDIGRILQINDADNALVLAHNFIEAALDLNLSDECPWVKETYAKALNEDALFRSAEIIAAFVKKDLNLVLGEIKNLITIGGPQNLSSVDKLLDDALLSWLEKDLGRKIERQPLFDLLKKCQSIIKPTFLDFLDDVVIKMKRDFKSYVKN